MMDGGVLSDEEALLSSFVFSLNSLSLVTIVVGVALCLVSLVMHAIGRRGGGVREKYRRVIPGVVGEGKSDAGTAMITEITARVLHGGLREGNCARLAAILAARLELLVGSGRKMDVSVVSLREEVQHTKEDNEGESRFFDAEDFFTRELPALRARSKTTLVCVLLPTHDGGAPPRGACTHLVDWLEEAVHDFRVGTALLRGVGVAAVGAGDSEYGGDRFLTPARRALTALVSLGGTDRGHNGIGCWDDSDAKAQATLVEEWMQRTAANVMAAASSENDNNDEEVVVEEEEEEEEEVGEAPTPKMLVSPARKIDSAAHRSHVAVDALDAESTAGGSPANGNYDSYSDSEDDEEEEEQEPEVGDLEDLVGAAPSRKAKAGARQSSSSLSSSACGSGGGGGNSGDPQQPREMVTPQMRQTMTKQGYKIVGTHSGVKLCRWTKSMLRGRGGCYKHSFYGIESHRCMEATPSLACANKCVFCWRHHSNPVGTEWKWKMEDADMLVNEIIHQHQRMINEYKGAPGVKPERIAEGINMKHCALSLVGEPIMYPQINRFVDILHSKQISTFLVTNAQFPREIAEMKPVTQLYVSVDAATKEKLKAIDRPLFTDYWERFLGSLRALRDKRQRTVYRLTLVNKWNMDEIREYAALIKEGSPDLIEIKGVTFCGVSKGYQLRMNNVPYHNEVRAFCEALCASEGAEDYGLAAEHGHSLCVLLARKDKFLRNGRWWTWIDYEKFQTLVASGEAFGSEDYALPTPEWSVYGATEAGFDPEEVRFHRKKKIQVKNDDVSATAEPNGVISSGILPSPASSLEVF